MASQWALLLFLFVAFSIALLLYRSRRSPRVRSIAAFEELPDQTGRATESGQTLHLSLGTSGVGGGDTVTSLAGMAVLDHLADLGVATDTPPLVTVSHPTLLPLAQNVLRRAYVRRGRARDFRWSQVRLVSPTPYSYALGTMDILTHEPVLANIMFGAFGPEVAFIARAGDDAGLVQLTGTAGLQALSILYSSTDRVVIGEELFATGAYLQPTKTRLSSLVAEDAARYGLIVFMIVVAVLKVLGIS
jgi:hypothetical protein